jgi:hypothetical protein
MSFRIEEKLFIIPENKSLFFKWVKDSNGKKIYSDRIVSSTYFDNDKLSMFHHSEEGVVPRKKLRLRSYSSKPHETTDTFLEKKISSSEGRYKISDPTEHAKKYLKYGIFDRDYGLCFPKVKVTYLRSYYSIKDFRFTYDRNINYCKIFGLVKSLLQKKDNFFSVEIKTSKLNLSNEILKKFPFPRFRFSKYCRGIMLLNH